MVKKGFTSVLIVGVIILFSVGLLLYFKQKPNINKQLSTPSADNLFRNTSLGVEITLPNGQLACTDGNSGKLRLGSGKSCAEALVNTVIITTVSGYQADLPVRGDRIYSRSKNESFLDWVKRFSQNDRALVGMSNNKSVQSIKENLSGQIEALNPSAIIEEKPNTESSAREDTLFIESQNTGKNLEKPGLMVIKEMGNPSLSEIASSIKSIPITTGDISVKVTKKVDGKSETNSPYPYYKGKIFNEDKKTIAVSYTTDSKGFFNASLAPGTYFIQFPEGFMLPAYNYLGDASRITAFIPVDEPKKF